MKKFLNNIKEEASHLRMSTAEKAAMRAAIFGAPSPVAPQASPYVFASFSFSHHLRMVLAGVLIFVLAGAGTASAAAGSALPGDILYPVKIKVNEAVKVALAPNPVAKAAVHAELADTRVEEAQALAAQGKLDATTTAVLAANFDEHAQSAEELADTAEIEDPAAAAQIKTKLASSLAVNGAVLQQIGKESSNPATKEQSDSLGARVIARAEGPARVAMSVRTFAATPTAKQAPTPDDSAGGNVMTMSITMTAPSDSEPEGTSELKLQDTGTQKTSAFLQKNSADALAKAKTFFDSLKAGIDATSTLQIEKEFVAADLYMSHGSAALGDGKYEEAQKDFTAVLRISTRLFALLVAQKKFDGGILKGLIRDSSDDRNWPTDPTAVEATSSAATNIDLGR